MNLQYEKSVKARLIPNPLQMSLSNGFLILKDSVNVELVGIGNAEIIQKRFASFWKISAVVQHVETTTVALQEEAYKISVSSERIRIEAGSKKALNYAMMTLRQMAEVERGKPGQVHYMIPCCVIDDSPACAFRAIHFCIFPETDFVRIETMIRMAAYLKYNYIVLEPWGIFPFKSHPEMGWQELMWKKEDFKHLLDVAKDCNITIIPQLNLFGHASFSRVCTAKHAVLDFHPELETLYEPSGWTYCLSNPETRKVLTDLVLELYEFFDKPPFFHIGCDESYDFQTCAACAAQDSETLLLNHLQYFRDLFAERNCRVIMWHDMLLMTDDPRWKGCIVSGDDRTRGILAKMPKDIIIADWQYRNAPESNPDGEFPTANYLKECGFDVVLCPWMEATGIFQTGAQVEKRQLFGLLQTTWNTAYQRDFVKMFTAGSIGAWCGKVKPIIFDGATDVGFTRNLRHVHQDMGITRYRDTGHTNNQILVPDFQNK